MWVCCRLCVVTMTGSTFFLTRRCEDNLRSFLSNRLPDGRLIECVLTRYSDKFRHGGVARVEGLWWTAFLNTSTTTCWILLNSMTEVLKFSWYLKLWNKERFWTRNQPFSKQIHRLYISFCPSLSLSPSVSLLSSSHFCLYPLQHHANSNRLKRYI